MSDESDFVKMTTMQIKMRFQIINDYILEDIEKITYYKSKNKIYYAKFYENLLKKNLESLWKINNFMIKNNI